LLNLSNPFLQNTKLLCYTYNILPQCIYSFFTFLHTGPDKHLNVNVVPASQSWLMFCSVDVGVHRSNLSNFSIKNCLFKSKLINGPYVRYSDLICSSLGCQALRSLMVETDVWYYHERSWKIISALEDKLYSVSVLRQYNSNHSWNSKLLVWRHTSQLKAHSLTL
jgi:hypothetical protein